MYLDVYIAEVSDPSFSWEKGNWQGNIPKRTSPFFPNGHQAFYELKRRIEDGRYIGKQTDWGGWVAKVSKGEILEFLRFHFDADADMSDTAGTTELVEFVNRLDENQVYALVAAEL